MRVAIVCDWLLGTGGAERVILELHKVFPNAPIYTSQYDKNPKNWYGDKWFEDADIRTTWLQKLPKPLKKFLPPLRAWVFSRLNLDDYDLVISSSGAEAKFVKVRAGTKHISYIHAPTHYYWARYEEYLKYPGFGKLDFLARFGLRLLVGPMRHWDFQAAQRPDYLIANSNYTKEQIKKYYGRDAVVIHPPVDIERFEVTAPTFQSGSRLSVGSDKLHKQSRRGFVTAGRQVLYKKIDLAVKTATQLNAPLVVIGRGPDHSKLKRMAGRSVIFLTNVSDEEIARRFAEAEAFIFPGVDDFGIVAVEAMAAGTPVIAYKAGGALDYVDKTTGIFFNNQTPESLAKAMQEFSKLVFNHDHIAKQAKKFSPDKFRTKVLQLIKQLSS
ncbi:glycosyltransferase [Candidatus Saccharibacteria bacterium]|nr:glycosyltransferase [Candidatus Saccharibacteria bacterium]